MAHTATLTVDLRGYWHPGTGRGQGTRLDAVTHRDVHGLPVLPGRTVKGLLRDAVTRWEGFGGYYGEGEVPAVPYADQLFGPHTAGEMTWPGLLRFSDATLPAAEADYLAAHPELLDGLYRDHFGTAIDHATGTAREKTLRGMELVVPLTLHAHIAVVPTAPHQGLLDRWPDLLMAALPLVRAVGARRTRGLGRAVLTLEATA
jgi:hypothetical protein